MPFGVSLRAAGAAVAMPPMAAILGELLGEMVPLFNASNSMLATSFNAIAEHALTLGLLSALILLIASAVTESEVRV